MGATLNHNRVSAAVGFSKDFNDKHHAKSSRSWSRQKVIWAFNDTVSIIPREKTGRQYSSSASGDRDAKLGRFSPIASEAYASRTCKELAKALASLRAI
jgi:hypothetical protein